MSPINLLCTPNAPCKWKMQFILMYLPRKASHSSRHDSVSQWYRRCKSNTSQKKIGSIQADYIPLGPTWNCCRLKAYHAENAKSQLRANRSVAENSHTVRIPFNSSPKSEQISDRVWTAFDKDRNWCSHIPWQNANKLYPRRMWQL